MSSCGCEGSCPVCRLGEVDNHGCNRCGAKFCPKCHGVINKVSENVLLCRCERRTMTQEGMPMEFELIDKETGEVASNDLWTIDFVTGKLVYNEFFYTLRQAIGATSSDDQKLYLGDLFEFWFKDLKKPTVGLLIWDEYGVMVKYKIHPEKTTCSYTRFYAVEYHTELIREKAIKRLGSCYTHPEILKKAGLE